MAFVCNQSAQMLQKQRRVHYTSGSEEQHPSTHPSTSHTAGPCNITLAVWGWKVRSHTKQLQTHSHIYKYRSMHMSTHSHICLWPMMLYAKSHKQIWMAQKEMIFKNKRNILCRCNKTKKLGGNLWRVTFDIMRNERLNHVSNSSVCLSMCESKRGRLQRPKPPHISGRIGYKKIYQS